MSYSKSARKSASNQMCFSEKNFFEKSPLGDHGQNFIKTQLGGGTGDFMAENIFPKSTSDSMQIFTLISNMTSVLDSN